LLDEAPLAWNHLLEQTPRVQGTVSLITSVDGNQSVLEYEYRTCRSGCVIIQTDHSPKGNSAVAHVTNADYSFILSRNPQTDAWTLTKLHLGPADQAPEPIGIRQKAAAVIFETPMVVGTERLADLFHHPTFTVEQVLPNRASGNRFVDVTFSRPTEFKPDRPADYLLVQGGRLTLDPARHWCLVSAELRERTLVGVATEKITNDLDDRPGPVPFVKKAHSVEEWSLADGKKMTIQSDLEFKASRPAREPADEVFRLTAFGLPEPVGIAPPRRPIPRYVWFLIAAAGLGVLAVLFRVLARRRGTATRLVAPTGGN
jgi:hypothetical protein